MKLPIVKFIQYALGHDSHWNTFNEIIPNGCCIICRSDNLNDIIFKIGDGVHRFIDLPIAFYFKYVDGVYTVSSLDIDTSKINHLLYINDENKLEAVDFKESDFIELFNNQSSADLHFTDINPIINGPDKIGLSTIVIYNLTSYSIFSPCGNGITSIDWILPGNIITTISNSNELVYQNNFDDSMINQTITIKARVKDKYNNYSRYAKKDILVTENITSGYVKKTILT